MRCSPSRLILAWIWLLTGGIPAITPPVWADVTKPGSAPVNTDPRPRGRDRERRDSEPVTMPAREDRIPVVEPKRFKLLRGEPLQLTLDTVEDPFSQRVRFFIREEPKAGSLSELSESPDDFSSALVTYQSDPTSKAATDQFTFAAQYPSGRVSAAVPVVLEIIDPVPLIACVSTLDFGKTILGGQSLRTIVLTNKGTAPFELVPELPPPWKWMPSEGQTGLRLSPGESAPATFGFFPVALGHSVFRLALPTGAPEKPGVLFTGEGVVPFVLASRKLTLAHDLQSRLRTGTIALTNPGVEGVSVTLRLDARLQSPGGDRVWLDKEQRKELTFVLPPQNPSAFTGEIHLEANGFQEMIPVTADPLPGFLSMFGVAADHSLPCGQVSIGSKSEFVIKLRNVGGQPVPVRANPPPPPFLVQDLPLEWTLPPGGETELRVHFAPKEPGLFRERLVLRGSQQEFVVTLHGESMAVPSAVETTAAANLSGKITMAAARPPIGNPAAPGQAQDLSQATDYHEMLEAKTGMPASVSTQTGRELNSPEAPNSVTGRNGEIPLPPMISIDGMLALSPHKLKTDVKLPKVPIFAVKETTAKSALLVWRQPQGDAPRYEVETRIIAFNGAKKQLECLWVPTKQVKFSLADQIVTAEVSGLQPESYHLFRIFTLGANGTNSLPSRELGARTKRATLSTGTILNLGVAGLVIGGGVTIFMMLRRERLL